MKRNKQIVAVAGASPKPDRYSFRAIRRLKSAGHRVIPINPAYSTIDGIPSVPSLTEAAQVVMPENIDTITLYLSPTKLTPLGREIIDVRPGRVIFNPGTESPKFQAMLDKTGIPWIEACTLVLLATGQF